MAANRRTDIHTHARAQCSRASVGLAQASINIAEIQFHPLDKVASLPQGVLFVVLNHLRSV